MPWDLESFTEPVASVLEGYPNLALPLLKGELRPHPQLESISRQAARQLFPDARQPECARSGLLLMLGSWEESHEAAQDISGPEGSYWHAIAHRIEPDYWNSGYWFRRVGSHPVFEDLRTGAQRAREAGESQWEVPDPWDPFAFLEFCEAAATKKNRAEHDLAVKIQSLEWRLLFEYCAARR